MKKKYMTIEQAVRYMQECPDHRDFAVRGDDFTPSKKFRRSWYHGDDTKPFRLAGVSAVSIPYYSADYVARAVRNAKKYGKTVHLISGTQINAHEIYHDPGECLIIDNKIECIIIE